MATSFFGYAYYKNGTTCTKVTNGYVAVYFKKVDSESSPSKWITTPKTVSNAGYYSFSIEDAALLGVGGVYKRNKDKLYICYYQGNSDRSVYTLTHAAFVDTIIPQSDATQIDIILEPVKLPILDSTTFPSSILTKTNYTMSETSHADYTWYTGTCGTSGVSQSQKYIYDTIEMFKGHQVTSTIYDWGDGTVRTKTNSTNDLYQYTVAGVYTQKIKVQELWNTFVEVQHVVTIKYNKPIQDFNWSPTKTNDWNGAKIKGQELITFTNLTTDLDNRSTSVYTYEWTITDKNQDNSDNTKVYSNKDKAFKPTHAFQSAGVKTITLKVFWNDGFVDKVETISKTLEVFPFTIVMDFNWDILVPINRGQTITFNPDLTTGDVSRIVKYDWVITDRFPASQTDLRTFGVAESSKFAEGSPNASQVVLNTYNILNTKYPAVKFHSISDETITLTITYNDGWKDVTSTRQETITKQKYSLTPVITSTDLTPQGRHQEVTFTNSTVDSNALQYTVDWYIEDSYLLNNYDNPTKGLSITDNSKEYLNQVKTYQPKHKFQSTLDHDVDLTIRYDDGWQEQTKRTQVIVKPYVFPAPNPLITVNKTNPRGRDDLVIFTNATTNGDTLVYNVDWYIEDSYSLMNYDNPNIGVSVTDNSVEYYNQLRGYKPEHYFQSTLTHNVIMDIRYDDGFEEQKVTDDIDITPIVYEAPVPDISWDPVSPVSRYDEVTFNNVSQDSNNRITFTDWLIHDFYEALNLDNVSGVQTDNTKTYSRQAKLYQPKHQFQTWVSNDIDFRLYYDDGFEEKIQDKTETITPTIRSAPVPDFDWSPLVPISRNIKVTFEDLTSDSFNRHRKTDWRIEDYFDAFNEDNSEYGVIKDNLTLHLAKARDYNPEHYFQSYDNHNVTLKHYYDDGWKEAFVTKTETVTTDKYVIQAEFDTTPDYVDYNFIGPIEISYNNITEDLFNRQRSSDWTIDDVKLDSSSDVYSFNKANPLESLLYTYKYPSRRPFTSIEGEGDVRTENKEVKLEITYDDGWENNIKTSKIKYFEASPYEIEGDDITIEENI